MQFLSRATDGVRTRDPDLGKVVLYQLSHVRMGNAFQFSNRGRRGSNPVSYTHLTLPTILRV